MRLPGENLSDADVMPVEVAHAELLDAVRLNAQLVVDDRAARLILRVQLVGIIHPQVEIPRTLHDLPVGFDDRCIRERQHHGEAIAPRDAKIGWVAVEGAVLEPELIGLVVGGGAHITHQHHRGAARQFGNGGSFSIVRLDLCSMF